MKKTVFALVFLSCFFVSAVDRKGACYRYLGTARDSTFTQDGFKEQVCAKEYKGDATDVRDVYGIALHHNAGFFICYDSTQCDSASENGYDCTAVDLCPNVMSCRKDVDSAPETFYMRDEVCPDGYEKCTYFCKSASNSDDGPDCYMKNPGDKSPHGYSEVNSCSQCVVDIGVDASKKNASKGGIPSS